MIDTHTLTWYLTDDRRLGETAGTIMDERASSLIIPAIVLAEIKYIADRERIPITFATIMKALISIPNCTILPLDTVSIEHAPTGLEIHDGLIVGTALYCRAFYSDQVTILTRDVSIIQSGVIPTQW